MWAYLITGGEILTALLLFTWILRAWPGRTRPGGRSFLGLLGFSTLYFFALGLEGIVPQPYKIFWLKIVIITLSYIPLCFFYFLLFYTYELRKPSIPVIAGLAVVPTITSILVLTNRYHHWMWTTWDVIQIGDLTYLRPVYTHWFTLHMAYTLLLEMGTLTILLSAIRTRKKRVEHIRSIFGIFILLLLMSISWHFYRELPLAPVLIISVVSSMGLIWAFQRGYLTRLVPLARSVAIENLRNGFMLLNTKMVVVDVNPAFARLLKKDPQHIIGQKAHTLLASWPEVLQCLGMQKPCQVEINIRGEYCSVDVLPLYDETHRISGWILSVRDITRYRQLEEDLQRRIQHLEALFTLGKALAPLLDITAICQQAVDTLFTVTRYNHIALYLLDPATGDRVLKAGQDLGARTSLTRIPAGKGLSERPLKDGRLHYTPDVLEEKDYIPGIGQGSEVDVPIRAHDEVVGVLVIESEHPHAFDENDLNFFMAVANQVGLAIERAMTYHRIRDTERAEQEQQKRFLQRVQRQQQAIAELITHPAVSEGYAHEAFRLLTEVIARTLNIHQASVWELSRDLSQARCPDLFNALLREHRKGRTFPLEKWQELLQMLGQERVLVVEDVLHDPRTMSLSEYFWQKRRVRAFLVAPVRVRGTLAGFLVAEHLHAPREWTLDEIRFMSEAADIAAQVILHAHLREWMERLTILNEVFLDITALGDVNVLLQKIVERAVALLDAEAGLFLEADSEREHLIVRVTFGLDAPLEGLEIPDTEGAIGYVLHTQEPLLIGEYQTWPVKTSVYAQIPQYHAIITVPVLWQDQINGVLQLLHSHPHHFTEEDVKILNFFARQVAIVLHNASLLENERRRRQALEALHHASVDIASANDLSAVLERVLQFAVSLLSASNGHIFLYDGENLHFGAAWWREEQHRRPYTQPRPQGITYTVAREGKPIIVPDVNTHPLFEAWKWGGAIASFPLKVRDKVVGVMNVAFDHPYAFPEEEIRLIELFADQAAIAIENARLLQESEERARHLAIVRDILQLLNSSLDQKEVFPTVAQRIQALTGAAHVSVTLATDDRQHFIVYSKTSQVDLPPSYVEQGMYSGEVTSAVEDILAGRIHITHDLSQEQSTPLERWLFQAGLRSRANIPMREGQRIIGSLNLAWTTTHGLDEHLIPVLQQIADAMALAIERSHLLETIQHQAQELSSLYKSALTLASTLDLDVLLKRLAAQIEATYQPDSVAVLRCNPERGRIELLLVYENGQHLSHIEGTEIELDQVGLLRWVIEHQQSLLIHDLEAEQAQLPIPPVKVTDFPIRSWLGIPLQVGDRLVGVLTLQAKRPRAFTEQDVRFLEAQAPSVALALENARLYEREHTARMQAERLFRAAQALSKTLDLNAVFSRILHELRNVVPYDSASVQELQDKELVIIGGDGFPNLEELRGIRFPLDSVEHPNGLVIRRRKPVILEDASKQYPAFKKEPHAAARVRSWLGVPMLYGDRVIGMIALDKKEPGFYTEEHARIAMAFAAQAAVAIENARLFSTVQEQAQRIQRILDVMPEGVVLFDAEYKVSAVNPRGQEYLPALGVTSLKEPIKELGGHPIQELLKPSPTGLSHEIKGKDQRIFEVVAEPLVQGEEIGGWVMLIRDVTHEREVQRRIEQHERLAVVGQLAAGIAHDFNNILQGIIGFSEMLAKREDLPEDVQRRLKLIAKQGNRAVHLIRQILDFSRHTQPRFHVFDMRDMVDDLRVWLQEILPSHIDLRVTTSDEPCWVYADPVQIQQVFMNLISNARDAMPDGGILHVTVSCITIGPEDDPPIPELPRGKWSVLRVSDTGVGIPAETLPHIFEPFFTTKDVDQGVGLGLAQVYGIIQQHNGYIDVQTALGKGTTFSVYLPYWVHLEENDYQRTEGHIQNHTTSRILVITRDAGLLKEIGPGLTTLGYRVNAVPNTEMALHILYARKIQVEAIIIDAQNRPPTGILQALASTFTHGKYPSIVVLQSQKWVSTNNIKFEFPVAFIQWPQERKTLFDILTKGGKAGSHGEGPSRR